MEYIPVITAIIAALIFVFTIVLLFGFYKKGKLSAQALQDAVILEIIALIGIVLLFYRKVCVPICGTKCPWLSLRELAA